MTPTTAPAPEAPVHDTVLIPSRLFGPLEVPASSCINFPDGLLGFGGERRFVLLPAADADIFWLHAVDQGNLAFLVIDPFANFPGYEVDLPEVDENRVNTTMVLTIVTLGGTMDAQCTANLQAPLVLDLAAREGRQIVLQDVAHPTRHPVDLWSRLGAA